MPAFNARGRMALHEIAGTMAVHSVTGRMATYNVKGRPSSFTVGTVSEAKITSGNIVGVAQVQIYSFKSPLDAGTIEAAASMAATGFKSPLVDVQLVGVGSITADKSAAHTGTGAIVGAGSPAAAKTKHATQAGTIIGKGEAQADGAPYSAVAVTFDGANDYGSRDADLTGNGDSKLFLASFWSRSSAGLGTRTVFDSRTGSTIGFNISIANDNTMNVQARNSAGTIIALALSTTAASDGVWTHYALAGDLANGVLQIYKDEASDIAGSPTITDDTIDFTKTQHRFGANGNVTPGALMNGDLSDVQVWFGVYADLSNAANLAKLISVGEPVNPIVSQAAFGTPIVRLINPVASWHTNTGPGLGFTLTGALAAAGSSPSD
jgi:hypothetical protein